MKARPTSLVLLLTSENSKFFSLFKGLSVMFRLSIDIYRATQQRNVMITWKIQDGFMRKKDRIPLKFNSLFTVSAQSVNNFPSCGGLKGFWNVEAFSRCCFQSFVWISSRLLMWDLFQWVNYPFYCLFISVCCTWVASIWGWRRLTKMQF